MASVIGEGRLLAPTRSAKPRAHAFGGMAALVKRSARSAPISFLSSETCTSAFIHVSKQLLAKERLHLHSPSESWRLEVLDV
eukprot:scaffold180217_cov34-Tisochrysis_lutea.AAC.4